MVDAPDRIWTVSGKHGLLAFKDERRGATEYVRADITERQLAEARADAKLFEATAKEAARGLECLNDIDEAWDAFGTAANRGTLTLAEQISSVSRELDAAETERDRLAAEVARLREALRPFADVAERYGMRYLAKRETFRAANPQLNLPHNYAQAVFASAEQTGWNVWENAIAALASVKE